MKIVFKLFYIRWHCHIVTISYGAEEINDEDDDHYHDDDGNESEAPEQFIPIPPSPRKIGLTLHMG